MNYDEIYTELVFERNMLIEHLNDNGYLDRKTVYVDSDTDEKTKHSTLLPYRRFFRQKVTKTINELDGFDAVEALYDFNSIELGKWTDSEANKLELELRALQKIIGKLEGRYDLKYRVRMDYVVPERTLYLNRRAVMSPGASTIKHRLLTTLFSNSGIRWKNDDIEDYFVEHFGYKKGQLKDTHIRKAANDITAEVAIKSAVREFLDASGTHVSINPKYIP
jgi:hypothetical protein